MQHHQLVTAATALSTLPETDVPIQLTVMCMGRKAILLRPVAAKGKTSKQRGGKKHFQGPPSTLIS